MGFFFFFFLLAFSEVNLRKGAHTVKLQLSVIVSLSIVQDPPFTGRVQLSEFDEEPEAREKSLGALTTWSSRAERRPREPNLDQRMFSMRLQGISIMIHNIY